MRDQNSTASILLPDEDHPASLQGQHKAEANEPKGLAGFCRRLAQYYAEFLSTDFKKQRLPRRRLQSSDARGHLVGIALRKYPGFQQKMWEELRKPIGAGLSITISRGTWRSNLPKAVVDAIGTFISNINQKDLEEVISRVMAKLKGIATQKGSDPAIAFEQFVEEVRAALAKIIVSPLLDRMEGFFERTENKPVESLSELEDQLSFRLVTGVETASGAAFSTFLVHANTKPLEEILHDQLALAVVRQQFEDFFASFSASDLYVELSDLIRSLRLIEDADLYLHIGEVHHSGQVFPAFYIPIRAERAETSFKISSDQRFYVNKRAMDYVAQEVAQSESRTASASVLPERIFYLAADEPPIRLAQRLIDEMAGTFNLKAKIDFTEPRDQKVSSAFVTVTNSLSISLFDRSDESMINDYESLVTGIDAGGDVINFFKSLIDDFLLRNPVPVRIDVDREWDDMPMTQRLVFDSPLPLVEEQRKTLSAIKHPQSRFIAVEGPPGTGKSHTITAVAFELIVTGKNLLVLSDKKEALDVVEDKLNQALAKVRPSEDFPNPILRLGKDASNYSKLLSKNALLKLQVNQKVLKQRRPERERALKDERGNLTTQLEKTVDAYSAIDLLDIATLESDVASLIKQNPLAEVILKDQRLSELVTDVGIVLDFVQPRSVLVALLKWQGRDPRRLIEISRLSDVLRNSPVGVSDIAPLTSFTLEKLKVLEDAISEIENAKIVFFGYLFARKRLRGIAKRLEGECKIQSDSKSINLKQLKTLHHNFSLLRDHLHSRQLEAEFSTAIYLIASELSGQGRPSLVPSSVLDCAQRLDKAVSESVRIFAKTNNRFYPAIMGDNGGSPALIRQLGLLKVRELHIAERFNAVPKIDYIASKAKIESLNTQSLAEKIDDSFINFYDNQKADAMAFGKIIREKLRFPVDKFGDLQRAFPCVIAGLRDYAEFVPLQREMFDLVIIDEASQVSIAQALPAIIRAKKVLVLGDRNQFGNVKTTNASREVNSSYFRDVVKAFSKEFADVSEIVRAKLDLFDIRRSVLDFVEPISNFSIQLRKHFRSYPEMISFSSKYFYGDSLQVMKIRGKPIEDVIQFDRIDHDGLIDKRNINTLEAEHIVERLVELLDRDPPPSVGIITPHTEQQAFIAKVASNHPRSDELFNKLRLKIMTFDSCQGDEREIIFYSLVATEQKDRLAYVFPSKLDRDESAEVDHSLRLQRLNVGLSRGQEKIVFVHSKPVEEYSSSLKVALAHFRSELGRAKALPTEADVDAASPMESKVLHWLAQVPIIRDLDGDCEIIAQFEIGKYLAQLDPTYRHPEYRVDFLILIEMDETEYKIALEYDGFEFHFAKGVPAGLLNSETWREYLTPADIEREKVLESFGVSMIRLNRFNLGKDPVGTIDRLLRERLEGMRNGRGPHDVVVRTVEEVDQIEEGLKSGGYKRCKKCDRDLPIAMFKNGISKSGIGRYCNECRSQSASVDKPRFRRSHTHW